MPSVNSPVFTKMQARPVPIKIGPCNAISRHSQQVRQNAGKQPKSTILLRLGNTTDNFKESPIPIIDRKPESPILITTLDPAFQPSRTNATRYRHTIPATPHDPARSPIRHDHTLADPVHYNNATRHTLTGMAHDRQAGGIYT